MKYTNTDKALEIAHVLKIEIPDKWAARTIQNRELQKKLIARWKRRKKTTFCGQYTSDFFLQAGYDMSLIIGGKHFKNINTTGQYKNAVDAVKRKYLKEVSSQQAFYLACIARPVLVLSPKTMVVNDKPYNHAAVTWPVFWGKYNEKKGPAISQQGWSPLCPGWVSSKAAWGKVWTHEMVKYFLPGLK